MGELKQRRSLGVGRWFTVLSRKPFMAPGVWGPLRPMTDSRRVLPPVRGRTNRLDLLRPDTDVVHLYGSRWRVLVGEKGKRTGERGRRYGRRPTPVEDPEARDKPRDRRRETQRLRRGHERREKEIFGEGRRRDPKTTGVVTERENPHTEDGRERTEHVRGRRGGP